MTKQQRNQLRHENWKREQEQLRIENSFAYRLLGYRKAFEPITGEYVSRSYHLIKTNTRTKMIDVREKEMLSREVTSGPLYAWQ